ncbi:MAG: hypothetical protein PHR81_04175 [Bacteroidales bacterium]|nr:hypothetical protein [Bacteroidales bacterium]MDD4213989.1 hypothetical protein [Bacteroidales bacterium]
MKKLVLVVLVAFVASAFTSVQAQEKKDVTTKASVYEKTRGADPNITVGKPTDDTKAVEPEKARSGVCTITVNNYTPYGVDIYVDGSWVGTISAYTKAYTTTYSGSTKIYGKSIGGTYYWGPQTFYCDYEYTWNLWE